MAMARARAAQLNNIGETEAEDNAISACASNSASLRRKLITIRKFTREQWLDQARLSELAHEATQVHESLSASSRDVSARLARKRKRVDRAEKSLRTEEALADWRDCQIYRLRLQIDAILVLKRMPKRQYDEAQAAARDQMDWFDAGLVSTSPRGNGEEGERNSRH